MVAVTVKNTSFDEDLTIVIVKLVLVYNFKTTFRYVATLESRCRNVLLAGDIKMCFGFLKGALETTTKI